ncbi:MAG: hypothetical protein ACFFCS_29955 [Candidatus Hodarchaeota archaeon]
MWLPASPPLLLQRAGLFIAVDNHCTKQRQSPCHRGFLAIDI